MKILSSLCRSIRRYPVTAAFMALIWSMFVLELWMQAPGHASTLLRMGALPLGPLPPNQWWRLVSYALLHDGWWHIGLNSLLLWIVGPVVEGCAGARWLVSISLAAVVTGGLSIQWFHHAGGTVSVELGASGALFGLLGAAILMALDQDQPLARPMRRRLCLTLGYGLLISLWPGVSLAAHLGGLRAASCIWVRLIYGGRLSMHQVKTR